MITEFFPNLTFGWVFLAALTAFLAAATYMDLRVAIIPKWITISALPVGLAMNAIRCGWLTVLGETTWPFGLGVLDGLLFGLGGFLFGFVFYFILWILGVAGGGDVKLCAAIGAWVGAMWTLWIVIVSIVIVLLLVLAWGAYSLSKGSLRGLRRPKRSSASGRARRVLTFSTPLCLATLLVLGFKLHKELGLELKPVTEIAARAT